MDNFDHSSTYKILKLKNAPHILRKLFILGLLKKYNSALSYLDVGCSNGYLTNEISQSLNIPTVVGIDYDPAYIAHAKKNFPHLQFLVGSIQDESSLTLPQEKYDLITCMETLEHVGDPQKAIENLLRLKSDRGALLISVPIETGAVGFMKLLAKHYVYKYSFQELQTDFPTYLRQFLKGDIRSLRRPLKADWGTHFGFDWKIIKKILTDLKVPFKTKNIFSTKVFIIDG